MPKAKAKAKQAPKSVAIAKAVPKPKAKLDRYAYLPTDLQWAAVFMDRTDFLRKLQKGQHDREYRHVATHGSPPLSPRRLRVCEQAPRRGHRVAPCAASLPHPPPAPLLPCPHPALE